MTDYVAIADDVEANNAGTVVGVDYQVEFARMSAETISEKTSFPSSSIKRYLMLVDKWMPLKASADPSAEVAMEALTLFDTFQFDDADVGTLVEAKVGAICDALVTATLIDATDKATIMGFGNATVPKWPGLTFGNVQTAMMRREKGAI